MVFGWDEPRRVRIGKKERELLHKGQGGKCNYCGRRLSLAYMHVDHKTPVAREGSNRVSNLQLLCSPCNTRKGDMTDGNFRRKYKLTPTRQAKRPPKNVIPQKYFEDITKSVQATRRRRASRDSLFNW